MNYELLDVKIAKRSVRQTHRGHYRRAAGQSIAYPCIQACLMQGLILRYSGYLCQGRFERATKLRTSVWLSSWGGSVGPLALLQWIFGN